MDRFVAISRLLVRLALGGLFLYAAWNKWLAGPPNGAHATMYDRYATSAVVHYLFLSCEMLLGAWLLSGWRLTTSSLASICLLGVFCTLIMIELQRRAPRDCGCGIRPVIEDPFLVLRSLRQSLMWNGLMVGAALWLWIVAPLKTRKASPDSNAEAAAT